MMKMRNLLLGFILGLLIGHSTPVNCETSIPPKPDEDVLQEAMTDGFLVGHSFLPLVTTESTQKSTATQASVQPPLDFMTEGSAEMPSSTFSKVGVGHSNTTSLSHVQGSALTKDYMTDGSFPSLTTLSTQLSTTTQASLQTSSDLMIEGSGEIPSSRLFEDGHSSTISLSVSHTQSPTFAVNPDDSDSVLSTIQTFQSDFTSLAVPREARSKSFSIRIPISQITSPTAFTSDSASSQSFYLSSGSGSGDSETASPENVISAKSSTETTGSKATVLSKKMTNQVQAPNDSQPIIGQEPSSTSEIHKGHNTPDWIIIVGFLVGLAALIMLCAAIATKDKWNAPKQTSENINKTIFSDHKMELEMKTFLQKDEPKEEGKETEYTVISLEELPENYSSD